MDETLRDTPEQLAEHMLRQGASRAATTRFLITRDVDPDMALSAVQRAWQLLTHEAEVRAKRHNDNILRRAYDLVREQYNDDQIIELLDEAAELTADEKNMVLKHIPQMRAGLEKEQEDRRQWVNRVYEYAADMAARRITSIRIKELLIEEQGLDEDDATTVINNLASYREQRKHQEEKQQEYLNSIYQRVAEQLARRDDPAYIKKNLIDDEGLDSTTSEMIIRRIYYHRVGAAKDSATGDIGKGAGVVIVGLLITGITYALASGGGIYVVAWGAVLFGGLRLLAGCARWLQAEADLRRQLFTDPSSLASKISPRMIIVAVLLILFFGRGIYSRWSTGQAYNQTASGPTTEVQPLAKPSPTPSPEQLVTSTPIIPFKPNAVVVAKTLNLRDGPGTIYRSLSRLTLGEQVEIVGQATLHDWFKVRLSDKTEGWLPIDTKRLSFDASARTVPEAAFRMRTGFIQHGFSHGGNAAGATGELTVYNDNAADMVVVLLTGQDTYSAAFIRSNESFLFAGILNGAYSLVVTPGENWNGTGFSKTAVGWTVGGLLSFEEKLGDKIEGAWSGTQYYTPGRHAVHIPSKLENNSNDATVSHDDLPIVIPDVSKTN